MSLTILQQIAEKRRSIYSLNKNLPISNAEIIQLTEHTLKHTPSAFNSQSTRLVVLFGAEHEKLWEMTSKILHNIINNDEAFTVTNAKINGFKAGARTILFFEDKSVVSRLQAQYPSYASNFPIWSGHASAMHQYAIWTALTAVDVGANLQHYNPIIDEQVMQTWQINPDWQLVAQMVFGGIAGDANEKQFEPIENRMQVFGN